MRILASSKFRRTVAATLDSVADDHAPVLITRGTGKPAVVLMSLEAFASHEETHHLLRNPRNASRLLKAVAELAANFEKSATPDRNPPSPGRRSAGPGR